jgi:hypothetical protein
MTYLDHRSPSMTLRYAQSYDETLKNKFKAMVQSGQATGGIALATPKEQIDHGDESELDWVFLTFADSLCHGATVCITRRLQSVPRGRTLASRRITDPATSWLRRPSTRL